MLWVYMLRFPGNDFTIEEIPVKEEGNRKIFRLKTDVVDKTNNRKFEYISITESTQNEIYTGSFLTSIDDPVTHHEEIQITKNGEPFQIF